MIPAIKEGDNIVTGISDSTGLGQNLTVDLLNFLARNDVGILGQGSIRFDAMDKMRASILALRMGADLESLASVLSWRDFEALASRVLETYGFECQRNFRLKRPRMQIDLIGIKDGMALLFDCKHWRYGSPSMLGRFARKQLSRAVIFAGRGRKRLRFVVPALLTLHMESILLTDGVPVVPVVKMGAFLEEMHGYLDRMRIVAAKKSAKR